VLTRRPSGLAAAAFVAAAVSTVTTRAAAQDDAKDGLRRPERLTVGVADQFLGQLAPDRKYLYFASNRHTTNEIYTQNIDSGRARLLFDEGAEVTWPKVSPDGKSILYVSYSERATGQLCVRDLPSGEHRRCLDEPSAALLAEWIDNGRIALVARASIDGNLRVLSVKVDSKLSSRTLLERNVTSLAVSPDGRWLVYVPLERSSDRVGPAFAAHAAKNLEAVKIDAPGAPVRIAPELPGLTGQPVFAKDGRSLYFVQFFSDSNRDGVVDGSDHGVLFRVPLSFGPDGHGVPVAGPARQLTDESWNCQYPAPAPDRLLTTCSRGRNLDLYSLPLDGEVPGEWAPERLATEIELASSHAKLQLLYYERLARSTSPAMRRFVTVRLVRVHLALEEFAAAEHYARRLAAMDDAEGVSLSQPLLVLIDHRKAIRARERGRIVEDFEERARARIASLAVTARDSSGAAALKRIVRSEIADNIGDKSLARTELEAIPLAQKTPRTVLEAYYERADALYRELDDREALVTACRRLAESTDLALDDRLRYARAAVRAMVRGVSYAEAEARLARERESAAAESELAFALELGRALLAIRDARPGPVVRKALVDMYEKQTRVDRRRAIMLDAIERATQFGADPIIEGLAEQYVDSVDSGAQERRRAERLYTRVIVGRAFRRRAAGRLDDARADFEAVARRTGSLEAVVGSIDLRLRAGEPHAAIRADYEARRGEEAATLANFVTAYLLSRQLSKLEGEAHESAVASAIDALKASWADLKKQCMAQSLYGAVLHEEYLRTGELESAERAGSHYLVALELVGDNLRYRAMVLGQLGILHTQVGNYRMALGYLDDRDRLPYADNSEGFGVRLARARSLLHVGREKDAATEADEALEMLDKAPRLAPYRILALDRAALYNLAAGRFSRALALYDAELPLLEADQSPIGRRNRFVARLAHAAAALGAEQPARTLADLDEVDRAMSDPRLAESLGWPHATKEQVDRSYRLITTGLRAQASERLGRLDAAARSLEARRKLLEVGLATAERGEFVRMLALVEAQLADNAVDRHDSAAASASIRKALEHADNLRARAKGAIDTDQLDVLWLAAQMSVVTQAPAKLDVPHRLRQASDDLVAKDVPAFRSYVRWFEIYETLTGPLVKDEGASPASSAPSATTRGK
jgi:cellulose synthase operon protein C